MSQAAGKTVLAFTASPRTSPESKKDGGYIVPGTGDPDGTIPTAWFSGLDKPSLHNFLSQDLDQLVISVPLTKETHHMLSTAEFDILSKKKTFVSNISRGAIIDQPALVSALKDGKIRGAALDVTDPEPLPEDDELWDAPNCIVTPHISGINTSYTTRSLDILRVNLERLRDGEGLINVVNRKRGY